MIYTDKNLEKKRKELCDNIDGIVDGSNIYSQRDLYEKDDFLCTFEVINREIQSVEKDLK